MGRPRVAARVGRNGELLACVLYLLRGYRVLGRSVRTPYAQVDLVCRRGDALVLVEVKRRRTARYGTAIESLGPRQAERLARAATYLAQRSPWAAEVRVDLVAIDRWRVRTVRNALDGDTYLPESMRGWI